MSAHDCPCPVPKCERTLQVDPAEAQGSAWCSCDRRERLSVILSGTGRWLLRAQPYSQAERHEHNVIMHALATGRQGRTRESQRVVYRGPDEASATMEQAFLASHAAAREVARHVLTGHLEEARAAAERHAEAEYTYVLAARRFGAQRRRHQRTGAWRKFDRYRVKVDGVAFSFDFEAYWDERGGALELGNQETLESLAGVQAGPEAWRQLLALLVRLEAGKPGVEADVKALVWQEDRDHLRLRPSLRVHFKQVPAALEVLRRSLRPVLPHEDVDEYDEPEWARDAAQARPTPAAATSVAEFTRLSEQLTKGLKPAEGSVRRRRRTSG